VTKTGGDSTLIIEESKFSLRSRGNRKLGMIRKVNNASRYSQGTGSPAFHVSILGEYSGEYSGPAAISASGRRYSLGRTISQANG
jgi:hypothetical protein